jgi:RNA polymerase sigma-70 factor (ECF subfamily)
MDGNIGRDSAESGADEKKLVEEVLAGNVERFYELVKPCERLVYLAAQEILQNEADAEEVAQEAVLKSFRNLRLFRGESKFSTWLYRITVNEARMRLRKRREVSLDELMAEDDAQETTYAPLQLADWREIPGQALEQRELQEQLATAVASLPDKYREVLILRDINGLSIAETAEALTLSLPNVKTRLLRARLMLRDSFVAQCSGSARGVVGEGRK